jgi:hypothetical protein
MKYITTLSVLAGCMLLASDAVFTQTILTEYSFDPFKTNAVSTSSTLNSNTVSDILVAGSTIWLGTGRGLSRSTDGGATWKQYYNTPDFGTEDISAIAVHGNEVWVATAHSTVIDNNSHSVGSGLHYSADGGETWQSFPQPVDKNNVDTLFYNSFSTIRALGVTTAIDNITYDIAVTDSAVWICSFAGMARKSTDKGKTWQRVILPPDTRDEINPKDTLNFDLSPSKGKLGLTASLNHRAFSVLAEDNQTIWIGSAGGINKSTDGGVSWRKFSHQNQTSPISGNFIVGMAVHNTETTHTLWAASKNAEDPNEKQGVSFTADGGQTWKTGLLGEFVHNVGTNGRFVYAVTDNGIFRTSDLGATWSSTGTIYDDISKQRITTTKFYCAASRGTTSWFGSNDGVATTVDDGSTPFGSKWTILRAAQALSSRTDTYAYPNPFSPDDEVVRIHYSSIPTGASISSGGVSATIRIFDFGMHLVRTLIQNAPRTSSRDWDEIWNGKDDNQKQVVNGVYFYQVIVNNGDPIWGKILVLQ